jgi:hypothetical protein
VEAVGDKGDSDVKGRDRFVLTTQLRKKGATAGVEIKEHLYHILLASTFVPMSPSNTTEREYNPERD